jgi:glucose/arabinose dehydrogenase
MVMKIMGRAGAGAPSGQPHHPAARRRRRRRGRIEDARVPGKPQLAVRHGAGRQRRFYVANTDALVRFPYQPGQTSITAAPVKVVDLPGGPINHHWTKNIIASRRQPSCT